MTAFLNALPGAVAQGLIWGLAAIGIYIAYKILDIAVVKELLLSFWGEFSGYLFAEVA